MEAVELKEEQNAGKKDQLEFTISAPQLFPVPAGSTRFEKRASASETI